MHLLDDDAVGGRNRQLALGVRNLHEDASRGSRIHEAGEAPHRGNGGLVSREEPAVRPP